MKLLLVVLVATAACAFAVATTLSSYVGHPGDARVNAGGPPPPPSARADPGTLAAIAGKGTPAPMPSGPPPTPLPEQSSAPPPPAAATPAPPPQQTPPPFCQDRHPRCRPPFPWLTPGGG